MRTNRNRLLCRAVTCAALACGVTAASAAPVPAEILSLDSCAPPASHPGGPTVSPACFDWLGDVNATSYVVYRGNGPALPTLLNAAADSCEAGVYRFAATGPSLVASPPAGGLFWYLVAGRSASGEGPSGAATAGPRVVNSSGPCCNEPMFLEGFGAPNGAAWPSPWVPIGSVLDSAQQAGAARWRPVLSNYSLARLYAPYFERNVEALFTIQFEDIRRQGIGFYVRQNGGYLQQSATHGQGYAVFVEGFRGDGIGVWKEENGQEISLNIRFSASYAFQNGVRYRVRFRVTQPTPASTLLQARIWPEAGPEPPLWDVEFSDPTAVLQGVSGGFAVDSWNNAITGGPTPLYTLIDDIQITRLCP